jgi:diaminohydroxyphosphoribosylaminopyrimidine deaminase/5-amino-6-(5-phosphoribosylamino)uracil reductase
MSDARFMRRAIALARHAYGLTSPNPMVGAVLVKGGRIIGEGWHRRAGEPHAEIEAIRDAQKRDRPFRDSTLYVTLEPCCTHGRTPPCTEAIIQAGIKSVRVGATDPNPRHRGKAFRILRKHGVQVVTGVLAEECERLNESFNHWIVHRTPFVTIKAGMTLDGKIATASGESKWITSEPARANGMRLRQGADAILVGINTILADNPGLTFRGGPREKGDSAPEEHALRRIVLDSQARTPLQSQVVSDDHRSFTTIVVSQEAPKARVRTLPKSVSVLVAPARGGKIDLKWLLRKLGAESVTNLLVEGGGEVNASFLEQRLAHRIAFFYAPKVLGGRDSRKAVAGNGAAKPEEIVGLTNVEWSRIGPDLFLSARIV